MGYICGNYMCTFYNILLEGFGLIVHLNCVNDCLGPHSSKQYILSLRLGDRGNLEHKHVHIFPVSV